MFKLVTQPKHKILNVTVKFGQSISQSLFDAVNCKTTNTIHSTYAPLETVYAIRFHAYVLDYIKGKMITQMPQQATNVLDNSIQLSLSSESQSQFNACLLHLRIALDRCSCKAIRDGAVGYYRENFPNQYAKLLQEQLSSGTMEYFEQALMSVLQTVRVVVFVQAKKNPVKNAAGVMEVVPCQKNIKLLQAFVGELEKVRVEYDKVTTNPIMATRCELPYPTNADSAHVLFYLFSACNIYFENARSKGKIIVYLQNNEHKAKLRE